MQLKTLLGGMMSIEVLTQSSSFPFVLAIVLAAWSLLATRLTAIWAPVSRCARGLLAIVWISACMLVPLFLVLLASEHSPIAVRIAAVFTWVVPYGCLANRAWRRARHAA